jgi:hypothetical protein
MELRICNNKNYFLEIKQRIMKTIKVFLILYLISMNFIQIYGQRNMKGRIIDGSLDGIMGAQIMDKNNNIGLGQADSIGFFNIVIPNGINKLGFIQLGYEFANIEISDSCNYIEVILLPDLHYDFMSSRKIDKHRKKEFDKLLQFHLNAFRKGIFTKKTICYSREFEPIKPKLDEISLQIKERKKQIVKDYNKLGVGDTIYIPFTGNSKTDNTENATLSLWSGLSIAENYDSAIEGIITQKHRKCYRNLRFPYITFKKGYNFTYKVLNFRNCKFTSAVLNGKLIQIGHEFELDMRIFKTIIKNSSSR